MNSTKYRLDESIFFLSQLKNNQNKLPEFNYFLNAYVNSARSITWIMQAEYKNISGWREWYDKTDISEKEKQLLKGIVDMRNRSIKSKPLTIDSLISIENSNHEFYNIADELKEFEGKKMNIKIEIFLDEPEDNELILEKGPRSFYYKGKGKIVKSIEEFKGQDILDVCIQYNEWLSKIVNECIEKFG